MMEREDINQISLKAPPKSAKGERILNYIKKVWSKKPIRLKITDGNNTRYITAKFDPSYDESGNLQSDASKLMGGNRHGTSAEQRVTLDLADDYYQIAGEARYNYSKKETGKDNPTHKDVKVWHYFVNDIYFAEYDSDEYIPYRVSINIKERDDGEYFYSFSAEKQRESDTPRTLHAAVNVDKNTNANVKLPINNLSQKSQFVNIEGKASPFDLAEPTQKDIARAPTAEESIAAAISNEQLDTKQRRISDFVRKHFPEITLKFSGNMTKGGLWDSDSKTLLLNTNQTVAGMYIEVLKHEFMHRLESKRLYQEFEQFLFNKDVAFGVWAKVQCKVHRIELTQNATAREAISKLTEYYYNSVKNDMSIAKKYREIFTMDGAQREMVADFFGEVMFNGKKYRTQIAQALADETFLTLFDESEMADFEASSIAALAEIAEYKPNLFQQIVDWVKRIILKLRGTRIKADAILAEELERNIEMLEDYVKQVYNSRDTKKAAENGGGVEFKTSLKNNYDYSKSFAQQIDDYKSGKIPNRDTLLVGATPDIYQSIGLNALPMTINTTHIDYALNGTKDVDHHLGEAMLKQLPERIKEPIAVFVSQTKGNSSVVALLNFEVNGKRTVAPIVIDGFGVQNSLVIDSNAITSVYGKGSAINQLYQAAQNEANGKFSLLYINKKEADSLLHRAGHQLSGSLIPRDGFYHSIRENDSPVKSRFNDITETQQFKRWFGDWQKHPNTASKVVDKDGKPLVMYHGSNSEFTTFDLQKSGGNYGDTSERLMFFTNKKDGYPDSASDYAREVTKKSGGNEKAYEVYLQIFKPLELDSKGYYTTTAYFDANYESIYNRYLSGDYDGIIIKNSDTASDDGILCTVDRPTQIKSATDNIGTFDGNNGNIKFAVTSQMQQLRYNPEAYEKYDLELSEPALKDIARAPTAEESIAAAISNEQLDTKQRRISDFVRKHFPEITLKFSGNMTKGGLWDSESKTLLLNTNQTVAGMYIEVLKHEFMHRLESKRLYQEFEQFLFNKDVAFGVWAKVQCKVHRIELTQNATAREAISKLTEYYYNSVKNDMSIAKKYRDAFTADCAQREMVADFFGEVMFNGKKYRTQIAQALADETFLTLFDESERAEFQASSMAALAEIAEYKPNLFQQIVDWVKRIILKLRGTRIKADAILAEELERNIKMLEDYVKQVYNSNDLLDIEYEGNVKYKLLNNQFPPYNQSQSDANEWATRWAQSDNVEVGDRKLVSYHNRWYLIEKFDDVEFGYRIIERVIKSELEYYKERYGDVRKSDGKSDASTIVGSNSPLGRHDGNTGRNQDFNSVFNRYGRKDVEVFHVDTGKLQTTRRGEGNFGIFGKSGQRNSSESRISSNALIHQKATSGEEVAFNFNTKKAAENGGVKHSIKQTSKIPYLSQLNAIELGKMNGSNSLYLGIPSKKLQESGFSNFPFVMNQSDYRKARRKFAKNKNYSSHSVPYSFFEYMPQYISESPLIIDNNEKATIVTNYAMYDKNGENSFVIVGVLKNQTMGNDTVNLIKSVYPLDDFVVQITKAAENGKLVVINKNKAEQMLATIGIQPAEASHIINLAKSTVTQNTKNVNTEKSNDNSDETPSGQYYLGTLIQGLKSDKEFELSAPDIDNIEISDEVEFLSGLNDVKLNKVQKHIVDICKQLDSGITVEFVDGLETNGKFIRSQNKILINSKLSAVQMYVEVFKHEFMHRLETKMLYSKFFDYCFKKSKAFEQYVRAELKTAGFDVDVLTREDVLEDYPEYKFNQYKNAEGIPQADRDAFTMEMAREEIIADFFAKVLFQGKQYRARIIEALQNADGEALIGIGDEVSSETALLELQQKEPTLLEQVIEWFKDVINRLRGLPQAKSVADDLEYIEGLLTRVYNSKDSKRLIRKKNGEVKYNLTYDEAIEKLNKNEFDTKNNTHVMLLEKTPAIYIDKAGAKNLKIIAGWDTIYLALRKSGSIPGNYHSLGMEVMKKVPEAIKNPLYIIKQNNGRIIAITEIVVKGNRSAIISLELDTFKSTTQDGENKSENYNLIVTFIDAKPNYLQNTIFAGDIVYNKNNESPTNFILRLKSLKKALSNDDLVELSNYIISNYEEIVNIEGHTSSFDLTKPDIDNIEISDEVEFAVGLSRLLSGLRTL